MSPSIKNNKKSTSLTTAASATSPRTRAITLQRYTKASLTPSAAASSLSSTNSSKSSALLTSNVDFVSSSSSIPSSSLFAEQAELTIKAKVTPTTAAVQPISGGRKISSRITKRTSSGISFPTFKIMSYPNIIALLTVLVCGLVTVNGLKCYMCGQYNEGVGSITPCLNYSEQYAHLYLKECSKKSEKYCVKYVSELSIVRDCATECAEKEIWETQTYCCPEDGCNGSSTLEAPVVAILLPLMFYIVNEVLNILKQRR